MNTFKTMWFSLLLLLIATTAFPQTKTERFAVSGECGMCKKKIETTAKKAGATYAYWSSDTKLLTVKYKSAITNKTTIQKAIAAVGYDTPGYKATEESYNKLEECCKYDRAEAAETVCCADAKCKQTACMKDGKCAPDASCCKQAACAGKDCCTKS